MALDSLTPFVVQIDLTNLDIDQTLALFDLEPADVVFYPISAPQRYANAVSLHSLERWPLIFARALKPKLVKVEPIIAGTLLAVVFGAIREDTIEGIARHAGCGRKTFERRMAEVQVGSVSALITAACLVRALDPIRQGICLSEVAVESGMRSSRRVQHWLEWVEVSVEIVRRHPNIRVIVDQIAEKALAESASNRRSPLTCGNRVV